ncbi:MAG: SMP-30/gluconolactonase/LRE family protein [Chloroflexota bacterium]
MVADTQCATGENPLWHPDERRLYWVDIPPGHLYRYDPASGGHERVYDAGEAIGGFTIQADGALLLFMARGAVKTWRNGNVQTVVESIPDELDSRFNDVAADPEGRVFCGTMATENHKGKLYRLDRDGSITPVLEGVGISNGIGFTPDLLEMYYVDSAVKTVWKFDYDRHTGALKNRHLLVQPGPGGGIPDGMTVDSTGDLWVARWDGGCLTRLAPGGSLMETVSFPARKVSCVTFGGEDYGDMYVTTALGPGGTRETEGAGAGALFRLRPPVGGVPEFRSRIGL